MNKIVEGAQNFQKWAFSTEQQREQQRMTDCRREVRKGERKLDRQIATVSASEKKAVGFIKKAHSRNDARILASELVRIRQTVKRLQVSKARLQSIEMQLRSQASFREFENSLTVGAKAMDEINKLTNLPGMVHASNKLSRAEMETSVKDEMIADITEETMEEDDELVEAEIERTLDEILSPEPKKSVSMPSAPVPAPAPPVASPAQTQNEGLEDEVEEDEMDTMRNRLEALKN